MIATRIVYQEVIYEHTCGSCGHVWEDSDSETYGCPHCTPPSRSEERRFAIQREEEDGQANMEGNYIPSEHDQGGEKNE